MQLDLNQHEARVLQQVVKGRINELLMEIANTDSRNYREELRSEESLLQVIFAKLGCVHSEGSPETVCSTDG